MRENKFLSRFYYKIRHSWSVLTLLMKVSGDQSDNLKYNNIKGRWRHCWKKQSTEQHVV